MAIRKEYTVTTTVMDAISTAYGIIEEIGGEMREWYENMPENVQNGDKACTICETADTLENIEEPNPPLHACELKVEFKTKPLLKRASRSDRLTDGLHYAYQAIEAIEARIEELKDKQGITDADQDAEQIDELETLRDEVQSMIDDAEGVEFPGMMG